MSTNENVQWEHESITLKIKTDLLVRGKFTRINIIQNTLNLVFKTFRVVRKRLTKKKKKNLPGFGVSFAQRQVISQNASDPREQLLNNNHN